MSRRYGISDRTVALVHGFRLVPPRAEVANFQEPKYAEGEQMVIHGSVAVMLGEGAQSAPTTGPGGLEVDQLNPDKTKVVTKTPPPGSHIPQGGCSGEADRLLALDLSPGDKPGGGSNTKDKDPAQIIAEINSGGLKRAQADDRVQKVFKAWSACMKQRGHSYTDPYQAAADRRWWLSGQPVNRTQISAAEDDLDCKEKTNLVGVFFAVESEYQNTMIEKDAEKLAAFKEKIKKQITAIDKLWSTHGG